MAVLEDVGRALHHVVDDIGGRFDVPDETDTLPGKPGHLFPVTCGFWCRKDDIEPSLHMGLSEENGLANDRLVVALSRHILQAVGEFIDDPATKQSHRIEIGHLGSEHTGTHRVPTCARQKSAMVFRVNVGLA